MGFWLHVSDVMVRELKKTVNYFTLIQCIVLQHHLLNIVDDDDYHTPCSKIK